MLLRRLALVCVSLLIVPAVRADGPKDPLRFVPSVAELVVKMERPRALLEAIQGHEIVQEALKIAGIREFYDSTNFRRLEQLITHFEKELGQDRHELLDALTGGGVIVSARFSKPAGALAIIQPKDPALLKRFTDLLYNLVEQELQRQESKEPILRKDYNGVATARIGSKGFFALVDGALLVSSDGNILKGAIDAHQGKEKVDNIATSANFSQARKSVPANAHLWGWINFVEVRKLPDYKTGFEAATQDPFFTFLFGGLIDVIKRTPSIVGYIAQDGPNWNAQIRLPAGREGMGGVQALVIPKDGKGTLPNLQPPRTIASVSYFMDLGELWKDRNKIFNPKQVEELDKAEKQTAKILAGARFEKLLPQMGNHHRVVFALPEKSPYKTVPYSRIPAIGFVVDMRDPQFAKSMNFILRGAALFGTFATTSGLRMVEEEHAGKQMVCYYFNESKPYEGDPGGYRFNFNPCFTQVGDFFVVSSTVELGKDLIDTLQKPSRDPASPATMRGEIYAKGVAQAVKTAEDQLLTQLILSQALPPAVARKEVDRVLALVQRMGSLNLEINYDPDAFRFDARWQVK